MKKILSAMAGLLAALQLAALEVPVLTPEQVAFLEMSPAERRERFTNKTYRAALAQHPWEKMKWREAATGESSRWRHLPGVPNLRDLGGLKGNRWDPSGGDCLKVGCFGEIEADAAARRGGNELRGYGLAK